MAQLDSSGQGYVPNPMPRRNPPNQNTQVQQGYAPQQQVPQQMPQQISVQQPPQQQVPPQYQQSQPQPQVQPQAPQQHYRQQIPNQQQGFAQPQMQYQQMPPNQPPMGNQPQVVYVQKEEEAAPSLIDNVLGLVGFILSIVSFFTVSVPVLPFLCLVAALICSIIGMQKEPKTLALAGLIITCVCFAFVVLTMVACSAMVGSVANMFMS